MVVAVRSVVLAVVFLGCVPPQSSTAGSRTDVLSASSGCTEGDAESCTVACSYNAASACNEAGRAYELGMGVTRSTVAANTFYRKACDLGDFNGCYNAAYLLEHGMAGRRDAGCALALYRRACDEGAHLMSCMSVGIMYRSGVEVPRDEARATAAFRKACDGGHSAACAELAKTPSASMAP